MNYKSFFAAFKNSVAHGNKFSKDEYIHLFTEGRTTSLKELSQRELGEITANLNALCPAPDYGKGDRMRKSIIAIFHNMDRAPAQAIAWAEKQGVRGRKRKFNDYNNGELYVLIRIAEKALASYRTSVRKGIQLQIKN